MGWADDDRRNMAPTLRHQDGHPSRFDLAVNIAQIGIWDYDAASGEQYWSPELKDILGLSKDLAIDPDLVRNNIDIHDREKFDLLFSTTGSKRSEEREEGILRYTRPGDNQSRWMSVTVSRFCDERGALIRLLAVVRDITSEQSTNDKLNYAAAHDSLTALPNRETFLHKLDEAFSKSIDGDCRAGVLIIDVDHLKSVNDTYGHDTGDELLRAFACRLKSVLRVDDFLGRLGGDEFAFLVVDAETKSDLEAIAQRILTRMAESFKIGGLSIECRPSIGGCRLNGYCKTAKEVLKGADLALYTAKSIHRGCFVMFHRSMLQEAQQRRQAITDLQIALSNNEIYQFYQPKVDLDSRSIIGLEALMRWRRPGSNSFLSPVEIQSALEDPGMAIAVFDRMLELVLDDILRWQTEKVPFSHVAINVSEGDIRRANFSKNLLKRLHAKGIPANAVQLEIIESAVFTKGAENICRKLEMLRNEGVKIALDDFGTGYAALSHLQTYPIDILKIDKQFIHGMGSRTGNRAIIQAILDLGKNFNLDVVAEGVETIEQEGYLKASGCRLAQGYLYSRPVPAEQVPELVQSSVTYR